jgi:hypothetical protein
VLHTAALQHQQPQVTQATTILDTIKKMELWEAQILENLEFLVSEEDVWDALCTEQCIIATTDGSAVGPKGSFGWIISDNEGNRLVGCASPVQAETITSYWSEGCGILSALRFLIRMCEVYWNPQEPTKDLQSQELRCDDESIVQETTKISAYKRIFPNKTVASEWDILAEIRTSMNALRQAQPKPTWIKGH